MRGQWQLVSCTVGESIVTSEHTSKIPPIQHADAKRDYQPPERSARLCVGPVDEPGPAMVRQQFDLYAKTRERASTIQAGDAKAQRPHPLERLLGPLDVNAQALEGELTAGSATGQHTENLQSWQTCVAVEAIGVGHQGPELLRRRAQSPFPSEGELL